MYGESPVVDKTARWLNYVLATVSVIGGAVVMGRAVWDLYLLWRK